MRCSSIRTLRCSPGEPMTAIAPITVATTTRPASTNSHCPNGRALTAPHLRGADPTGSLRTLSQRPHQQQTPYTQRKSRAYRNAGCRNEWYKHKYVRDGEGKGPKTGMESEREK